MSWDILISKFSRQYQSVSDITNDEKGIALGTRSVVQEAVGKIFPKTNWSDPAWGVWDSEMGSIEFSVGKDPAESLMLHVRATAAVVPGIVQLCLDNGWQGIDLTTGEFVESAESPEEGLEQWAAYRDRVLGQLK